MAVGISIGLMSIIFAWYGYSNLKQSYKYCKEILEVIKKHAKEVNNGNTTIENHIEIINHAIKCTEELRLLV